MIALALLASGVFFAWQAALLDFGRVGLPGPGFFPFVLGVVLCLLALGILYPALRSSGDDETVFIGHRNVLITLAALAGLAFAFERVDTYLTLGSFAAVVLLLVARAQLWRVVLGVALGMIAVWLFFGLALGVRLPASELWQQLADLVAGALPFGQP
jgi:hypothetical protein